MSTLLIHLKGNMSLNRTIFPSEILVLDDLLVYKKRRLFAVKEVSVSYHQISQVVLNKGIFFASLDIKTPDAEDYSVKFVSKKMAEKAKLLIDQKIYKSHAKHHTNERETNELKSYEKSLNRLQELVNRGTITKQQYDSQKAKLLRNI